MSRLPKAVPSLAGLLALAALLLGPASASAAAGPAWKLDALAATSAEPGGTLRYVVEATNVGTEPTSGQVTISAVLPAGLTATSAAGEHASVAPVPCVIEDPTHVSCSTSEAFVPVLLPKGSRFRLRLSATVDAGAADPSLARFQVSGGAAAAVETVRSTAVGPPPAFGLEAFDNLVVRSADGAPATGAATHPYGITTPIDLTSVDDTRPIVDGPHPVEPMRDVLVDTPPGFLGDPASLPQCSLSALLNGSSTSLSLCDPASQVGTLTIDVAQSVSPAFYGPFPLFNLISPPGVPARFGASVIGTPVILDATVRGSGDYGLTVGSRMIPEGLANVGMTVSFWGVPASEDHRLDRGCPGGPPPFQNSSPLDCPAGSPETPFLRNPTSCTAPGEGLPSTVYADSWFHPGALDSDGEPDLTDPSWKSMTQVSHQSPYYPYPPSERGAPVGIEDCASVPFEPEISARPTTDAADSPSGLDFHLTVPQTCWGAGEYESTCQSDLRDAEVTLPQGMSLNPSSANGLAACSPAQIGLKTPVGQSGPIHFAQAPATCPDASKIGTVEIASPLLGRHDAEGDPVEDAEGNVVPEPLTGSVYLAQQGQNPFGSLLAMYFVAEGSGVVIKQAGEIVADPQTGQIKTVFREAPQLPFSDLHLELFGGQRAPLHTPAACGLYSTEASLTGWSGKTVSGSSGFQITHGCGGGFDPHLSAGTANPLAGTTSPFNLRLWRDDASQELGGLSLTLPPGLSGYLNGIPYCPDSALAAVSGALGAGAGQEASPSCPAASQVGTVTVGAGAGVSPFYTAAGRAYLAGPYKGAPLSLAVVAPAVAGPFDLGSVVVRNALRVDPTTAQITAVSDPLPTILHGIPLDLRDVRVQLNRDHFTLNPTSCDPMQIASTITSAQGASASPSQRFQVGGCSGLGFKPRLSLKLKGKTRRSGNPALTAIMRPKLGNANASRIQVALPHSEFLAQSHIRTICTRVQFAADACPPGSVYGTVTATTPILGYPLTGKVYLRSSDHPLPDMVLKLQGPASQPIEIDAVGRIDSHRGGLRTTFEQVPDAPLSEVVLKLPGGKKSLLENSTDICRGVHKATVQMDAHNGRIADSKVKLRVAGCAKPKKGKNHGGHRRGGRQRHG